MRHLLLSLLLLSACISPAFTQVVPLEPVVYSEVDLPCFFVQELWVIRNQAELDSLTALADAPVNANCIDLNPVPEFDFDQYTLIGFGAAESGCNPPEIKLEIGKMDSLIVVDAKVVIDGLCREYSVGKKWCLIPKVEKGTIFEARVEKIYPEE